MPTAISLHLGLNAVDPKHYQGWDGTLAGCENDARDMSALVKARGFKPTTLLTKKATSAALLDALAKAATTLHTGDSFVLSYSGHGGQVPDRNGDETEDGQDETWCLYDRQVVDDELYAAWSRFEAGVHITVLSDSCHSGSVTREMHAELLNLPSVSAAFGTGKAGAPRCMPRDLGAKVYAKNRALYDGIQKSLPAGTRAGIGAGVILISGCQDNQTSADGARNGLFTEKLLQAWNAGAFVGGFKKFHRAIVTRMPPSQQPNLFTVGAVSTGFLRQTPFSV